MNAPFALAQSGLLDGPAIRPLALAEAFAHLLARDHTTPPKHAIGPERAAAEGRLFERLDGIALIEVQGLLRPGAGWIGCDWATGYDDLLMQIAAADGDPDIHTVVLFIESGGGYVAGLFELCGWLEERRAGQDAKPIVAICETAYSAAYALAAACDAITVAPMGGVGSIGTILVHFEITQMLENVGVTLNVVRSPDGKARGGMLEELDEASRAVFQRGVDEITTMFAAHVERGRAGEITAADALATNAAVFDLPSGTAEALRLGLADEVVDAWTALNALNETTRAA